MSFFFVYFDKRQCEFFYVLHIFSLRKKSRTNLCWVDAVLLIYFGHCTGVDAVLFDDLLWILCGHFIFQVT